MSLTSVTGGMRQSLRNISELRALEPAFDGQQVEIAGHTVAGIGGGVFYADFSDTTTADDNGVTIVTVSGKRWKRRTKGANYVNVRWFNAKPGNTVAENDAAFLSAISSIPFGTVYAPFGTYKLSDKISLNESGYTLKGDGPDLTVLEFYGDNGIKTGVEVNNGSWDDSTNTYTFGGTSIGSTKIQDMSIVSVTSINSTGVVFARATKQCSLDRVKIVGWDVPYRMYGAWYANINNCSIEGNVNPARIGYETNDFTWFECDHTSNANGHIEFESSGTCRRLQYISGSFDGLPNLFGVYIKNTSSFTFRDVYLEIYDADSNTAPFVQCGQNTLNVCFDGIDLIFPTDGSYTGNAIQLGVGLGSGAIGVGISNFRQYNSGNGVSISTIDAQEVCFGENVRVSAPIECSSEMSEISPSNQVSILTQAISSTSEITAVIGYTKRDSYSVINLKVCFTKSVDLTGRFLRIIRGDNSSVLINYPVGSVTAGTVIDLGKVTGLPKGTPIKAYTYKVGSSADWPAMTVTMQEL